MTPPVGPRTPGGSDRVTAIIPTHNRAHLVPRAIDSVFAQLEPGDELIVVDDGSSDDTPHVLAQYGTNIRIVRLRGTGVGPARNAGVRDARNPLIAFLDDDDEWLPDKLARQRALMAGHPNILCCFTDFAVQSADGRVDHRFIAASHRQYEDPWPSLKCFLGDPVPLSSLASLPSDRLDCPVYLGDFSRAMLERCYVWICTAVVRRDALLHAPFAEDLDIHEEWVSVARMSRTGPMACLDVDTALNHGHSGARMTGRSPLGSASEARSRVAMRERLWGSDVDFLHRYGQRYQELLEQDRKVLVRSLLAAGRRRESEEQLAQFAHAPMSLRVAAAVPTPMLHSASTLWKAGSRGLIIVRTWIAALIHWLHDIPFEF